MHSTTPLLAPAADDAALVRASREGSRDAFGQIVARYQTLICSLTYSATGSLGRSESSSKFERRRRTPQLMS